MKKLTLLSGIAIFMGLLGLTSQASAQITITESDFPYAGFRVVTAKDTTSGLLPGAPSSSTENWNFSTLQKQQAATTVFMLPGATPYSGIFTTANLADSTYGGNGYTFFDSSAARFSETGAEEIESAGGYNFQIAINASPTFTWANLPATYGGIIPLSYATGSQTFAVTLSSVVTGEKFDTYIQYSDTIDAFGTMQMPNGTTYNVLRQKHHETDYDSVFISILGGAFTYYERFVENKNQYDWYTNGIGYTLAEMDMSETFDTVVDVIWDTTAPRPIITSVPPPTVAVNLTNVSCNGGSNGTATAIVSGGATPYTYLWEPGGLTTSSVSSLNAGTYTLTVTGNNDSITTENFVINQPSVLSVSGYVVSNISCNGGSNGVDSVSVGGGTAPYTYLWSDGNSQSTINAIGLSAGTFTVTVTDSCGSSATASAVITQPAFSLGIGISAVTNVTCNVSGSITANAATGGTSPYNYSWTSGAGTNLAATNLSAGTYTITATDNNGCTASASATITQASNAISISIASQSNVSCNGGINGSATANAATGGTSPYTYSWSGSLGTNLTINNLGVGTYSIIATDSNGCSATALAVITQPAPLVLTADSINATTGNCDGSAWINVSGGTPVYTYSWSTGGQTTDSITGQCTGNYCATVTDANGCSQSVCVTISVSTGINQLGVTTNELKVYPNPNNGSFIMELSGTSGQSTVEVYSMIGQKVMSAELLDKANEINLSAEVSGVYFYRVTKQDGSLIGKGKIVIQK